MMKKNLLSITAVSLLAITSANAQLQINTAGTPNVIDFTGFDGSGFDTAPAAGQLDSDNWSVLGLSDGDLAFGASGTTGDYARGTSTGGVSTGGVYAFDDNGDEFLGVQPTGSDFTPGTFILRVQNNTGAQVNSILVSYDIKIYNNENRGNTMNFAHSSDNLTYVPEASADYTSPETGDASPVWVTESRTINITGLTLADQDFYYLSWNSNDDLGSGSRDELGIDNIEVTAFNPLSAITASGNDGCVNSSFSFTSTVTGGQAPFTFSWDFSGEGNSTDQNPTFTFTTSGTKTIDVQVEDGNGDIETDQITIEVYDNPTAVIQSSTTSGCEDLDVTFTDNSTAPGGQTITTWAWDFDNTNTSSDQNPPQETFSAGSYGVTLEVTTDQGCSDQTSETITVDPTEDASFSYGAATYCNQDANPTPTITGVSGGTFSSTTGLTIDAGTGEIDLANSTVGNYTVTYTTPGTCTGTETFDVEVTGLLDATISGATDLCEGDSPITLTAATAGGTWTASCTGCFDPGTGDFDPTASGTGAFTIDYETAGNCGDNDQVTINVNPNPTAGFTYTGATLNGGEVTFTNTSTDASFSSWDFDDTNTSMDENPVHTFATAGNYNVCLTVENASGCTDEYCENITVDTDNVSIESLNAHQVKVYPNPIINDKVTIEVPSSTFDIQIIDITGKVISTSNNIENVKVIDLSTQSKGIYFVKVITNGLTFGYKLIKK